VSNLQSQQIAIEAALIQLRAQQRLNRVALVLVLGGSPQARALQTGAAAAAGTP